MVASSQVCLLRLTSWLSRPQPSNKLYCFVTQSTCTTTWTRRCSKCCVSSPAAEGASVRHTQMLSWRQTISRLVTWNKCRRFFLNEYNPIFFQYEYNLDGWLGFIVFAIQYKLDINISFCSVFFMIINGYVYTLINILCVITDLLKTIYNTILRPF